MRVCLSFGRTMGSTSSRAQIYMANVHGDEASFIERWVVRVSWSPRLQKHSSFMHR